MLKKSFFPPVLCKFINCSLFFLYCRKLRERDASKFHAQLCVALFFMLLTFTVGITQTDNEIACTGISMVILYFTLASAFWMGAEAILMFKKLVIVFGQTTKLFIVVISLIAWGKFDHVITECASFQSATNNNEVSIITPINNLTAGQPLWNTYV